MIYSKRSIVSTHYRAFTTHRILVACFLCHKINKIFKPVEFTLALEFTFSSQPYFTFAHANIT